MAAAASGSSSWRSIRSASLCSSWAACSAGVREPNWHVPGHHREVVTAGATPGKRDPLRSEQAREGDGEQQDRKAERPDPGPCQQCDGREDDERDDEQWASRTSARAAGAGAGRDHPGHQREGDERQRDYGQQVQARSKEALQVDHGFRDGSAAAIATPSMMPGRAPRLGLGRDPRQAFAIAPPRTGNRKYWSRAFAGPITLMWK